MREYIVMPQPIARDEVGIFAWNAADADPGSAPAALTCKRAPKSKSACNAE